MDFTYSELMVSSAAKELKYGDRVLIGIGLPYVAAVLAKMTHAPGLYILLELGTFDSSPIDPSVGSADPRSWYRSTCFGGFLEVMGMIGHRGRMDIGLLGALEVDRFGNINSTLIKQQDKIRHIAGSGGANDTASLAKGFVVIARHEKRKLKETVDYITSPGFLRGGNTRTESGLRGGGLTRLITDKAVFTVDDDSKALKLLSIHPGISPEEIIINTGFAVNVEGVPATAPPTSEEIRLIREVIDPARMYTSE